MNAEELSRIEQQASTVTVTCSSGVVPPKEYWSAYQVHNDQVLAVCAALREAWAEVERLRISNAPR